MTKDMQARAVTAAAAAHAAPRGRLANAMVAYAQAAPVRRVAVPEHALAVERLRDGAVFAGSLRVTGTRTTPSTGTRYRSGSLTFDDRTYAIRDLKAESLERALRGQGRVTGSCVLPDGTVFRVMLGSK